MMQFRNIIGIAGSAVFFAASAFAEISVKTVSPDKGDKPYKNFGVVAGASLVYSF